MFCTAKDRQFTGTAAGARNEPKKLHLSLCKTTANFHILMLVLILHKDVHFLQNAKNLCYCQLIKGQRGSCSCSLAGETSQELTPRAAQYPWYSLARGGRAVGWNSEYQEEPLCFLAQSRCLSSALALPFSAFSACPQGRLD